MKNRVVFTVVAALCFAGCKEKPRPEPPPPTVEVTSVVQTNVPIYHEWIGYMDGLVNADIRAQVTGYLIAQDYKENAPVKKGDLLFEIDPRPFQAALDQAKGVEAEAEAQLGKTDLDVERYRPLLKDKAISKEEYDDAVQAQLQARATVVAAKAAVEQAQLNLGFTRITSPVDGIASISKAQIGNLVGQASGELTTVSQVDPIKVYYNVTEQAYINFAKLYSGENGRYERLRQLDIHITLADGSEYPFPGEIYAADREIGSTTGSLRLEALFPNHDYNLRPGEFARVRLKFDVESNALLVPQRAVAELQGSFQVDVLDSENKIHIQPVQVGERSGQLWIIKQGLKPTDRVVVEGLQRVTNGMQVNVTNYAAALQVKPVGPPVK